MASEEPKKRALVLSGGAAFGAFQVGALRYMLEEYEHRELYGSWTLVAGVSVGALNGTLIALDKFQDLKRIWATISNSKVYTGRFGPPRLLSAALLSWKSVLGNGPLRRLIREKLPDSDVEKLGKEYQERHGQTYSKLLIGAVSLATGEYHAFNAENFVKHPQSFRDIILASTSIPLFWPPVRVVRDDRGCKYYDLVDGGSRNVSPLGDIIDYDRNNNTDISEVVIINCDPEKVKTMMKPPKNLADIALRSISEIMVNEIFRADVREHMRINSIVRQARKKEIDLIDETDTSKQKKLFKAYETIVIQPDRPEKMGNPLDFSNEWVNRRINFGMEMAAKALAR